MALEVDPRPEGGGDAGRPGEAEVPLSQLAAEYARYPASGEINSTVTDQQGRLAAIEQHYAGRSGATVDHLDGLTVELADGSWFNLRASNTEPLLRLNLEARTAEIRDRRRQELVSLLGEPE